MSQTTLTRRLTTEASEMRTKAPENCSASPVGDNLTHWEAVIIGPKGSPFENGIFRLDIQFPQNYPFTAPHVKFVTPVYHPNINKNGAICLDILKDQWSPAITVSKLLLSICSLLTDPNPNDPLEPDVARVYKENKMQYEMTARAWTQKHASGDNEPKKAVKKAPAKVAASPARQESHAEEEDEEDSDDE
ncbi:ubiquitin-conjugating enzyme E2 [Fadolivirus algeromassiliense]|jgi:ubiquitin-conjugating enzyme E2 D/E|uniref:E2 ubiquitin-conjugating enzyme n=1 Tax=Fadolivirus FV1/VV64 TaxID=3070911 RepID=A0A7D3R0T5_9VIRU|nr:ubiquitin-conjugating enzyme E2 [Fadolivirus algeromassiliense]QKF93961.1 ubiquitin-conjugating enzyme E2 [Fadolivirus FV1/VV64]